MSSSFKFLNKENETSNSQDNSKKAFNQEDSAQSFLDDKLAKNRFTIKQQETLDANGGPTVANSTGDEFENGDFRSKAKEATEDPNAVGQNSNPFAIKGSGSNNDPMYTSGKWGKGGMTPEQIAEKFGLDRSSARNADGGNKDGDIWGTDATGNKVYIGSVTDESSLRGNSELISAHSAQRHQDEGDHNSQGEELSSGGDVNGALLNLWDGSGGEIKEPEKAKEELPVEHSPEIQQAKERVRSYEDDVLSGKVSDDIYGNEKYDFDATKGSAGIGTPMNGGAPEQAQKATASFLDNKKSQVKNQYQFKAQG